MGAFRDLLEALGGDHRLIGQMQDGIGIAGVKHVDQDVLEGVYSLAYNQFQAGNYDKASQMFLYLSFHDHTDVRFVSGYGACCFRTGQYEKAEAVLKQAVELDVSDPGPALNLANTYDAQGKTGQARDALLLVIARAAKNDNYKPLAQVASNMMDRLASPAGE